MSSTKDIKYYGSWVSTDTVGVGGWLHREDGPALTHPNGRVFWYFNGILYTFDEWLIKSPISDEKKMMLRLQYA